MPGKASAISRGLACVAVLAMAWGPFVPAWWQRARPGSVDGSHCRADGKRPAGLASWPAVRRGTPRKAGGARVVR
jgi:hypothetical protein